MSKPQRSWNHRIVRRYNVDHTPYLVVTEVHYKGYKPIAFALDWAPAATDWERAEEPPERHRDEPMVKELRETLERMIKALDQPILDERTDFDEGLI